VDIVNGMRGIVGYFIFNHREREHADEEADADGTIMLKYPPSMILFRPENEGLESAQGWLFAYVMIPTHRAHLSQDTVPTLKIT
jgi:hypothetical protein